MKTRAPYFFLFFLIGFNLSTAVSQLSYRPLLGDSYGAALRFPETGVASDFGPRCYGTSDHWHSGVDFNVGKNDGDKDLGVLILSAGDGMVRSGFVNGQNTVFRPGLKYIFVGSFSYVHIFNDSDPASFINGQYKTGNCILMKQNQPNESEWCIVYKLNNQYYAIGETTGKVTTSDGSIINVLNNLSEGDGIAPLGNSGFIKAHLHLGLCSGNKIGNEKEHNPLALISYNQPTFNIYLKHPDNSGNEVDGYFPKYGLKNSPVKILAQLNNAGSTDNRYNELFDINEVSFFIKNKIENKYKLIKGRLYNTRINEGGHLNEAIYNHDINSFGNWQKSGIEPRAYADPGDGCIAHPSDRFYFSDIYWRISKMHKQGSKINLSNCPEQLEYPDGNYVVKGKLETIKGEIFEGLNSEFSLDNFQPYVQYVDVLIDGNNIYSAGWDCFSDGPQFSGYECGMTEVGPNSIITIKVMTSEILTNLRGRIVQFPGGFVNFYNQGGLNWICSFQNFNFLKDGDEGHLEFSGVDLNGNQLLDLKTMSGGIVKTNKAIKIPIRESNNSWKPDRMGGDIDNVHKFCFKSCDKLKKKSIEMSAFDVTDNCISSEDLESSYEMESFNGAADAWIQLKLSGGVSPFFITYTDKNGIILKQGLNEFDLTNLEAGTYCYSIIDDHCCELNGCILICPSIKLEVTASLTHPSGCGLNDGSIRIISRKAFYGIQPYNFHLEDNAGNEQISDPVSGIFTNLSSGKYYLIATDAAGCTGSYTIELLPFEDIFIQSDISQICSASDGSILVEAFSPYYPDDTYNFNWSNGKVENRVTESFIDQLSEGKYCLTITSNTTLCSKEECYRIQGAGKTLELDYETKIPCANSSNGEIKILVTGGNKPYTYKWSNSEFRSFNKNLSAGEYCVTVTDDCQNSIETCINISDTLKINLDMEYNCPDKINLTPIVSGGNPPYSYIWSDGSTMKSRVNLSFGIYAVTVTDNSGCSKVDFIDSNPIEFLNPMKPCKGFWDGKITIKLKNPKNEEVDVEYDYAPCDDCIPFSIIRDDFSNPIQFTLDNLSGDKEYHFYVKIGSCFFEIKFTLGEQTLEEKFSRYDETSGSAYCVYDLVCKETVIKDGKLKDPILTHKGGNCKKLLFKECSKVEVTCQGNQEVLKTIPGKKIHMRRLEVILYAQKMGFDASSLSGNFCDHLWICHEDPFCIAAKLGGEFGGKFKGITKEGNCFNVKCRSFFGLINQDYKICDENFIPDAFLPFFRDERPGDESGGKPPRRECTPITLNFTDVLECWSKFVADDGKKFYESQLANLINEYRNKNERYCAWVSFCMEDYSILKTNLSEFKCREFDPPINVGNWLVYSTCTPHTYKGNDIVFCECDDPEIIAKYGICLEPKQLSKACTIALKNQTELNDIQILPFQQGNTKFLNFATVIQPEGFTTVNAIFSDESGTSLYHKYEPGNLFAKLEKLDNVIFSHHNIKLDVLNMISSDKEKIRMDFYSGNLNAINSSSIQSDSYLKLHAYYPNENGFMVSGEYKGHLYINDKFEAYSENRSSYILYRNDSTNTTLIHTISGVLNISKSYLSQSSFMFLKNSFNENIKLNGISLPDQESHNCFEFKIDRYGHISQGISFNISNNFTILDMKSIDNGLTQYILGKAKSMVQFSDTSLQLPVSDQLVLVKYRGNQFQWIQHFDQKGIDIQNIIIEPINNEGIALGLNVGPDCTLFSSNLSSVTNTDIVILQFNKFGEMIYEKRFSSSSQNNLLKAMYYSSENVLYLGGDISGIASVNNIGDVDLILAGNITQSGFISYLDLNTFANNFNTSDIYVKPNSTFESLTIDIYPNPTSDQLNIYWNGPGKVKLQIFDMNGIEKFALNDLSMNHLFTDIHKLEVGIYSVKITDSNETFAIKRFVKM